MKDDAQFESRLRRQTLKPIPCEWRKEILDQAARASEVRQAATAPAGSIYDYLKSRLTELLWASPRAWASLAAVWVGILMLNLAGGQEPTTLGMTKPPALPQARQAMRQKQLLLVELAGWSDAQETVRQRPTPPGPRSERREQSTMG
jgi:hypothetical protein